MDEQREQFGQILDGFSIALNHGPPLDGTLCIEFIDVGYVFVSPEAVTEGKQEADCDVRVELSDFLNIHNGTAHVMAIYVTGRASVGGNPTVGMRFVAKLHAARQAGAF